MSFPGTPPEFDDDAIDTLHTRWSARSARFQAMVSGSAATSAPEMSAQSDGAHAENAVGS